MRRVVLLLLFTSVQVLADESTRSYEQIVQELNGNANAYDLDEDPLVGIDDVKLHVAVGPVMSQTWINSKSKNLQGAEALIGIDLFSRSWIAEGAIRSFNRERFMGTDLTLKEFDLRLANESRLSEKTRLRLGGGVAARYATFGTSPSPGVSDEHTTPAFLLLAGLKYNIFSRVQLGADVTYRSSMVSDTVDRRALDGALRIGGSF